VREKEPLQHALRLAGAGWGEGRARLVDAVQANCHVADARHAADMTLCTYLLQMREFFRWERALPFGALLPHDEVGAWIAEREALWAGLEEHDFAALPCGEVAIDPFDVGAVDAALRGTGLVYGAGLVGAQRPVFFLAELHSQGQRGGLPVVAAGREWARGLVAPPAALTPPLPGAPQAIVVRREALARACWQRYEGYTLHRRAGSAMQAVADAYGLDADLDAALARWVDDEAETAVLHELGEHRVGQRLGDDWGAMRLALPSRRAELHARALRDLLADFEVTLPALLERGEPAPVHAWFAAFDGAREALLPALPQAYARWREGDGGSALREAAARGRERFDLLAQRALVLHRAQGDAAAPAIEALLTAAEPALAG
jgi:hypothetical protein